MFVDITDFKSALAVENILTPYKKGRLLNGVRQPKEPITPDVCMEVLRATNYARNIKDMLLCIADLPTSEQAQFKDVVLATFSNREQPDTIVNLGDNFVQTFGWQKEFDDAKTLKEGLYLRSSAQLMRDLVTYEGQFIDFDFSNYPPFEKLFCLNPNSVIFADMAKLPKEIEFSSQVLSVKFVNCDLAETKLLPLSYCVGYFEKVSNLPKDLDVHKCIDVTFDNVDLKDFDGAQLKNVRRTHLVALSGVPENLDVSQSDEVNIYSTDLAPIKELKFKDKATVCLLAVQNLPQGIDVSHCREFICADGSLQGFKPLIFDKDAVVSISHARQMPAEIDVSQCKEVKLPSNDWSGVKRVVFRDKAQMKDSHAKFPDNWNGQLEFLQNTNTFERFLHKIGNKISR